MQDRLISRPDDSSRITYSSHAERTWLPTTGTKSSSALNYCYRGGKLASVPEITDPTQKKFEILSEAPPSAGRSRKPQYFMKRPYSTLVG
jgi:hypothetical protein